MSFKSLKSNQSLLILGLQRCTCYDAFSLIPDYKFAIAIFFLNLSISSIFCKYLIEMLCLLYHFKTIHKNIEINPELESPFTFHRKSDLVQQFVKCIMPRACSSIHYPVMNDRNGISPKPKYGFFTEPEPKLNTKTIL